MRWVLFALLGSIALPALSTGLLLVINPDGHTIGLSTSLLEGSPFENYLVPGLVLMLLVGGINGVAFFYNIKRYRLGNNWAMAGGFVCCGWIGAQVTLLSTVSWLHMVYLLIGLLVVLIAYQLKGKWAV